MLRKIKPFDIARWPTCSSMATQQATIKVNVDAGNHLEALNISGLKEPGALISVNVLGGVNVPYHVDDDGKVNEIAKYGSVKNPE